jgi:hypothetical protein
MLRQAVVSLFVRLERADFRKLPYSQDVVFQNFQVQFPPPQSQPHSWAVKLIRSDLNLERQLSHIKERYL